MEGMEIEDIPKLKLPRPDSDIADDSEVKRLILACWRGADELRAEVSSTVMPKGKKNGGNAGSGGSQRAQQVPAQEQGERRALIKKRRGRDVLPAPLYGLRESA